MRTRKCQKSKMGSVQEGVDENDNTMDDEQQRYEKGQYAVHEL